MSNSAKNERQKTKGKKMRRRKEQGEERTRNRKTAIATRTIINCLEEFGPKMAKPTKKLLHKLETTFYWLFNGSSCKFENFGKKKL